MSEWEEIKWRQQKYVIIFAKFGCEEEKKERMSSYKWKVGWWRIRIFLREVIPKTGFC